VNTGQVDGISEVTKIRFAIAMATEKVSPAFGRVTGAPNSVAPPTGVWCSSHCVVDPCGPA
jgi:hypothetical protein